eukprot:681017-Prymnesium_polylepis.1
MASVQSVKSCCAIWRYSDATRPCGACGTRYVTMRGLSHSWWVLCSPVRGVSRRGGSEWVGVGPNLLDPEAGRNKAEPLITDPLRLSVDSVCSPSPRPPSTTHFDPR